MKHRGFIWLVMGLLGLCVVFPSAIFATSKPIILGVPTSLGFLEGKEGLFCVNMAVDEINTAGE